MRQRESCPAEAGARGGLPALLPYRALLLASPFLPLKLRPQSRPHLHSEGAWDLRPPLCQVQLSWGWSSPSPSPPARPQVPCG